MGSEYTGTATKSRSSVSYCTMILRMHVALALHVHTLNPTPYTLHPTTPTHYTIHPKPVLLTSASASLFCHQHPPARPSPPSSSCRLSATLVPPGPRLSLELQARGRCGERDCAARGRCGEGEVAAHRQRPPACCLGFFCSRVHKDFYFW